MKPTAACNTQCAQIAHTVLPCSALHRVFLAGQATPVWPAGHQGRLPKLQRQVGAHRYRHAEALREEASAPVTRKELEARLNKQ